MKERPILFSGEMVRAILEGRKTQTRRIVKQNVRRAHTSQRIDFRDDKRRWLGSASAITGRNIVSADKTLCPYGVVGDRLWVRETVWIMAGKTLKGDPNNVVRYRATQPRQYALGGWTPGIHMPRWASRITLEITDVRVQRLQDISEEDAFAEGVYSTGTIGRDYASCSENFADLWNSINAKRAPWDSNPWVWALTFRRVL